VGAFGTPQTGLVQTEVTPTIVAGVCDPGIPTATGLTEAGYNACPIVARAEAPECYPKTSVFEPCPQTHLFAQQNREEPLGRYSLFEPKFSPRRPAAIVSYYVESRLRQLARLLLFIAFPRLRLVSSIVTWL
jgi:hypothetical protein